MKRNRILNVIALFLFVLMIMGAGRKNVSASSQVLKKGTITLDTMFDDDKSISFKVPQNGYLVLDLDFSLGEAGYSSKEKINIILGKGEYNIWDEDIIQKYNIVDFPKGESGDLGKYGIWNEISAGTYNFEFENVGVHSIKIKYSVTLYSTLTNSIKLVNKTINVVAEKNVEIKYSKAPLGSRIIFKDISVDKPSIAEVYYDGDKIQVQGLRAGKCTLKITLWNNVTTSANIVVKNPSAPKLQYTSYKMYKGDSIKNVLKYTKKKVTWTSSNKKVATVNSKGKITAKGIGKCTITAKVGKSKYKCRITVSYQNPNFYAQLRSYNTRDNYFTVRFYNVSNKPIVINSGIKVINVDYKTFDRTVRLNKSITIKPKKKATVRFYVKGRTTWYDYSDYTLYYNFTFDGKKYEGHVWDGDSVFKNGKKWYGTYWNEESRYIYESGW